jgi:cytosine/adenosine deaminase-related metal-dependent hydrolase
LGVEADVSRMDSLQGVEFYSGILIPGMVNAHCHLELSYLKGQIPPGTGLNGFVRAVARLRHDTPEAERARAADVQNSLMYAEGVAAVADICNDSFTFPLKQASAIRYHNFVEAFGIDPQVAPTAIARARRVAEASTAAGVPFSVTPHATYSLSEPLFEAVIAENRPSAPLSIHFMESRAEAELFRGEGAFAERYRAEGAFAERYRAEGIAVDFTRFRSPAGRLIVSIPSQTPLLLVHNTFVTTEDIDLIHSHFDSVTWVVCPRSNDYIEHSFPPLNLLRHKGCRIAVGTDSLASNRSLSLIEELKFISARQPEIPLTELLSWALNGAQTLGLDNHLGSFEPGKTPETDHLGSFESGKRPGATLIDHLDWDRLALTPQSTARRIV